MVSFCILYYTLEVSVIGNAFIRFIDVEIVSPDRIIIGTHHTRVNTVIVQVNWTGDDFYVDTIPSPRANKDYAKLPQVCVKHMQDE